MRIDLLIRSLDTGGSQRQVANLALGLSRIGAAPRILTYYPGGQHFEALRRADVPVEALYAKPSALSPLSVVVGLIGALRRDTPSVLYAFLPSSTVLSAIAKPLLPRGVRLAWGLRAADMPLHLYAWKARTVYALQRQLRWVPDLVIANSRQALDIVYGAQPENGIVIGNAIDTQLFAPTSDGATAIRNELGATSNTPLIGFIGRVDPVKDPCLFIDTFGVLRKSHPDLCAIMILPGEGATRDAIADRISSSNNSDAIHLLAERNDLPALYSACNAVLVTSTSESLPNVALEALACGTPVVSTDVGGVRDLFETLKLGTVVSNRSPGDLAAAVERILGDPASVDYIQRSAPFAIRERFSMETIARATLECLVGG